MGSVFEESFVFFPLKYPKGDWEPGFQFEDCWFETGDAIRLHAWYLENSASQTHLLVLHGNAGNLTYRASFLDRLRSTIPVNVLALDYRGYGRSEGRPTEAGLYLDAKAAYDFLRNEKKVAASDIRVLGISLGSAVAVHLASGRETGGLIVQAAFPDGHSVIQRKLRIPGVPWLLKATSRNTFNSRVLVSELMTPKLHVHGRKDRMIPPELGQALFEAAAEPKSLLLLDNYGHDNFDALGEECFSCLREFLGTELPNA